MELVLDALFPNSQESILSTTSHSQELSALLLAGKDVIFKDALGQKDKPVLSEFLVLIEERSIESRQIMPNPKAMTAAVEGQLGTQNPAEGTQV